jgi:hypothetical protein
MGERMIETVESVASSKFRLAYLEDTNQYVASTENALGQFSSIGDSPEDANRRLRAKLFSLIASYIEKEKIHS